MNRLSRLGGLLVLFAVSCEERLEEEASVAKSGTERYQSVAKALQSDGRFHADGMEVRSWALPIMR